jgi:hypothetical protein
MTAENTSSEPGSEFWHGTGPACRVRLDSAVCAHNPEVASSNPTLATSKCRSGA